MKAERPVMRFRGLMDRPCLSGKVIGKRRTGKHAKVHICSLFRDHQGRNVGVCGPFSRHDRSVADPFAAKRFVSRDTPDLVQMTT